VAGARQSRIGLEFRRPTHAGDLRVVYENDFYDFNTGKTQFDLRHFYGQVANVLAGFTFSTIVDPDAVPDTLDFQGPGGVRHRKPRLRHRLLERRASTDCDHANIAGSGHARPLPLRGRQRSRAGRRGVPLRRGFAANVGEKHVAGIGVSVAGSQKLGSDYILYQGAIGKGFARYIQDTAGLAGDIGVDASGKIVANDVGSFYVAYQHYWSDSLRSLLIYGHAQVDSEHKTLTRRFATVPMRRETSSGMQKTRASTSGSSSCGANRRSRPVRKGMRAESR
jgi:hypothetical protein